MTLQEHSTGADYCQPKKYRHMGQLSSSELSSAANAAAHFPFSTTATLLSVPAASSTAKMEQQQPNVQQRNNEATTGPQNTMASQERQQLTGFAPGSAMKAPSTTKPIDIVRKPGRGYHAHNRNLDLVDETAVRNYNTAPSDLALQLAAAAIARPDAATSPFELQHQPRVVLPKRLTLASSPNKNTGISKPTVAGNNLRNDLSAYRERILNEAMRRRIVSVSGGSVQEAKTSEDCENKENNVKLVKSASLSRSRKRLNADWEEYDALEGTSAYNVVQDDGQNKVERKNSSTYKSPDGGESRLYRNSSAVISIYSSDESDASDILLACSGYGSWTGVGADENGSADDCLSTTPLFQTVGDIIGYAKVVRAQRNETLGRLNTALTDFDEAWACMRKAMEAEAKRLIGADGEVATAAE